MSAPITGGALTGWRVVALRAARDSRALRRAVSAAGGVLVCTTPWRIEALPGAADRLGAQLQAPLWVVTSPNAVRCAARLCPLSRAPGLFLSVGPGTARALEGVGVGRVRYPATRHDSEGLLAMPELAGASRVVLLTGEGGRGLIDRTLAQRGAAVERVDVYRRVPRRWTRAALEALCAGAKRCVVLLSSAEALTSGGPALADALRPCAAIAASDRVAEVARHAGLRVVAVAGSATPEALLEALHRHAKQASIR